MARQNFSEAQRRSAFECNADWLRHHNVDGIAIAEAFRHLRDAGLIHYCENCLFCHTDRMFFNVDHVVPDSRFRAWNRHPQGRVAINMMILCTSTAKNEFGCNLSKSSRIYVPMKRGLAFTRKDADMNCTPTEERPFDWAKTL